MVELFLNTPSHHRVHHGRNPQYIDKNYAGALIIWDRMFGTFEPEDETVIYGITVAPKTWNPFYDQFSNFYHLLKSASRSSPPTKLLYFLKPPGWNPKEGEVPPSLKSRKVQPQGEEHPFLFSKHGIRNGDGRHNFLSITEQEP